MKARMVFRYIRYSVLIVCLLVLVNPVLRSEPATYFGVTFPMGDVSFADRVADFLVASCVRDAYDDPEEALGPPDAYCDGCEGCSGCDTNAVSLGFRLSIIDNRGYLVLEFVDNVLVDVAGPDLFIYNTNQNPARVEISTDGYSYIFVGEIVGYPGSIDIGPYVNATDAFRFVRLSDVPSDEDHSNCPGPSIDAVGAMGRTEIVYTGEAFGSLELLPVGDLAFSFESVASTYHIILDRSSSMEEVIDGEVKIDVAKDVIIDLLDNLPSSATVGIRLFGGNCRTELLASVDLVQRQQLQEEIRTIEAFGATPLALALEETQTDLKDIADLQLILLISDGIETCGGNPVQAAKDLLSLGYDLRFHIVGFDISRNVIARDQLLEIAQTTGGVYYDAANSDELRRALSLAAPFSYTVYDLEGNDVFSGRLGESGPQLPAGAYTIVIDTTPAITLSNVIVSEQQTTQITVEQSNGGYQAEVNN
ncbi:VWA domain-containing protein [Candidatus Bipolaricaulota bacterium]|nr:VWA domain-containing protein [Candidatus Bipolaricaulota bacterium]